MAAYFLLYDHLPESGGSCTLVEGSLEPRPPPAPVVAWLLLSLANSLSLLLGDFQEKLGSLREQLHQLQLEISMACLLFLACLAHGIQEVCSFRNLFLVTCFLPCLSCSLSFVILCFIPSL